MLAASLMHMRRIDGVLRPAIVTPIPCANGVIVMVDCGATADPRAEHLVQFAYMGSAFATATGADADGPGALHGTWRYHSKLTAYQKPNSNLWYIAWAPDVLAPNLTKTTHLAAVRVAPQVAGVSDASGNDLTSYKDAGLTRIANLMEKKAPPGKGTPGLYVEIQNAAGKPVDRLGLAHPLGRGLQRLAALAEQLADLLADVVAGLAAAAHQLGDPLRIAGAQHD